MNTRMALAAAALLACTGAHAGLYDFPVSDGIIDSTGLADVRTISGSAVSSVASVVVTLDISGTYNGDLYGYLQHYDSVNHVDSAVAVLLNRIGRDAAHPYGFADAGMRITLSDFASGQDAHYQSSGGGLLTGGFQPDARSVNPLSVLSGDGRTTPLNAIFHDMNANGEWTLFLANIGGQGSSTLNSWSLNVELSGVPEPTNVALAMFAVLIAGVKITSWAWRRRRA